MFLSVSEAQYSSSSAVIIPPAFSVLSVEQDSTTQQIVVKLRIGGGPKHVPLLYMSQPGWYDEYSDQADVSTHPCQAEMQDGVYVDKTCCLKQFVKEYQTATDIENRFLSYPLQIPGRHMKIFITQLL
jgi:hypothetical protein